MDNTEQRRVENLLERNRQLLQIACSVGRFGGWYVTLPDFELDWTPETFAIHQLDPAMGVPKVEEAIHFYAPESRDKIQRVFDACYQHGTRFDDEFELITAKGNRLWVRSIGEPVFAEDGTIVAIQGAFQDISEQKAAEHLLLRSEERFQLLAESIPIIVWTSEPDGTVDYTNKVFLDYAKMPSDQSPAEGWIASVHPEDLPGCIEAWVSAVASQKAYSREFRIRNGETGEYRWHLVQAKPIKDEHGVISKWYGTGLDVHSNREAEETAKKLAQELLETLESISDAFFTVDRECRVLFANSRAIELMSVSLQSNPATYLLPDWLKAQIFEALDARNTDEATEIEVYDPENERWYGGKAYATADGTSIYLHDETEVRAAKRAVEISEERFRLYATASNDAIWDWDISANTLWWSKGYQILFGYEHEFDPPSRSTWKGRVHPEDVERIVSEIQAVIASNETRWRGEYRFKKANGAFAQVSDYGSVIRNEDGKAIRMVGGMSDLTDQRRLEEQVLRAQRLDSLGTLAGGVAHDLNNVLTPILFSLDLLKEETELEERIKSIDIIESCARRGSQMVSQLLSFARGG